jgi:hypothetical protein
VGTDCPTTYLPSEAGEEIEAVGGAWTVCVSSGDVLAVFPASPLYTATTLWLPADSALVVHVAVPPLTLCAPQPEIELPPSSKFTLPVGLAPVTVAVNVTA